MSRGARIAALAAVVLACAAGVQAVDIQTVSVGNPGNAGEWSGESYGGYGPDRICGSVGYVYSIAKFEVTAGQYTEFLNAAADDDTYGLYNTEMWSSDYGCKIERTGSSPNYSYSVGAEWTDRPVNYVSWGDAARFANWMHNGQPTATQGPGTTEDGSYVLNGATSDGELIAIVREPDATWVIPSEDEWYKAAYHYNDGVTGNYWDYPTSSDSAPGYVGDGQSIPDPDPGNYATYDGDGEIDGIGPPYYRTEVGEHENSESPYDTFDQGGNVWEWNEVVYGSYRGLRGGSFTYNSYSLHAAYRFIFNYPTNERIDVGFRVALAQDCNGNGIPDPEDIASQTSNDDNGDGIPDECGACCGSFGGVGCLQLVQNLCLDSAGVYLEDGTTCHGTACPIPAVSEWGLVAMALLVLAAGTVVLARRRAVTAI